MAHHHEYRIELYLSEAQLKSRINTINNEHYKIVSIMCNPNRNEYPYTLVWMRIRKSKNKEYIMDRKQLEEQLYYVRRILEDLKHTEHPRLTYPQEKEVVRKALKDYESKLLDKMY